MTVHHRTCPLCEAMCGLRIETAGDRVTSIRGDADDPLSRGYLCPKGPALASLHALLVTFISERSCAALS